jgi:hypothetical protein
VNSATVPTPIEVTRCRLTGLLTAVTAATAAVTWTVTTLAIDATAEPAGTATSTMQHGALGKPLGTPFTPAAGQLVTTDAQPVAVADAYHGLGILLCQDGTQPVEIADSYHGVGTTACP